MGGNSNRISVCSQVLLGRWIQYLMMQTGGFVPMANSTVSPDTLQTRYEKAIKQINRLIEINRDIKEANAQLQEKVAEGQGQLTQAEQHIDELTQNIAQLEYQNQALLQQSEDLDRENNEIDLKYMELEAKCNELEQTARGQMEQSQAQGRQEAELRQLIVGKEREIASQKEEWQKTLQLRQKREEELQGQLEHLSKVIDGLREEQERVEGERKGEKEVLEALRAEREALLRRVSKERVEELEKSHEEMTGRLQTVIRECTELKGKQIDREARESKEEMRKNLGLRNNTSNESDQVIKLIQQYKVKIRGLEEEKKEVEGKYKNLKSKMAQQKHVQEGLREKVNSLEQFVCKQEQQSLRMIDEYDHKINKVLMENLHLKKRELELKESISQLTTKEKGGLIQQLKCQTERQHPQRDNKEGALKGNSVESLTFGKMKFSQMDELEYRKEAEDSTPLMFTKEPVRGRVQPLRGSTPTTPISGKGAEYLSFNRGRAGRE